MQTNLEARQSRVTRAQRRVVRRDCGWRLDRRDVFVLRPEPRFGGLRRREPYRGRSHRRRAAAALIPPPVSRRRQARQRRRRRKPRLRKWKQRHGIAGPADGRVGQSGRGRRSWRARRRTRGPRRGPQRDCAFAHGQAGASRLTRPSVCRPISRRTALIGEGRAATATGRLIGARGAGNRSPNALDRRACRTHGMVRAARFSGAKSHLFEAYRRFGGNDVSAQRIPRGSARNAFELRAAVTVESASCSETIFTEGFSAAMRRCSRHFHAMTNHGDSPRIHGITCSP